MNPTQIYRFATSDKASEAGSALGQVLRRFGLETTAVNEAFAAKKRAREHSHYFKNVAHLTEVDVYRVLELFGVTDQAVGHAVKKLLCSGGRGVKDVAQDIKEARDTLTRWQEMRAEDAGA